MTRTLSALLAALSLAVAVAPAAAQTKKPKEEVVYRQKTILDITEDENVDGSIASWDLSIVESLPPVRHTSLIRPRAHFLHEMEKSAERF
jgi:hypothetical protein